MHLQLKDGQEVLDTASTEHEIPFDGDVIGLEGQVETPKRRDGENCRPRRTACGTLSWLLVLVMCRARYIWNN
jgi:hypothetical protein